MADATLIRRVGQFLREGRDGVGVVCPGFDVDRFAADLAFSTQERSQVISDPTGQLAIVGSANGRVTLTNSTLVDGDVAFDLITETVLGDEYFVNCALALGWDLDVARSWSDVCAPATGWLSPVPPTARRFPRLTANPRFLGALRELITNLSAATRDLCRLLVLLRPQSVDCGDEWAELTSLTFGRSITTAQVTDAILECGHLLVVDDSGPVPVVSPSSRPAAQLLTGLVPTSPSEHAALYRALRHRAERGVRAADDSDYFVSRQLPRQAREGNCLRDLLADPVAVLLSDTYSLAEAIESKPGILAYPAAKAFLLAAHQLALNTGPIRSSYLESTLLEVGAIASARELGEREGARSWRPIWHRAEAVNTQRILASLSSPVLAIDTCDDEQGGVIATCSDSTIWYAQAYAPPRRIADLSNEAGEIRACAYSRVDDYEVVIAATSDHTVAAIDPATGLTRWVERAQHLAPLSAAAAAVSGGQIVAATSGVDGRIRTWWAQSGSPGPVSFDRVAEGGIPIETRALVLVAGEPGLLFFAAVDGVVGVAELAEGSPPTNLATSLGVINGLAAVRDGDVVRVALGSAEGFLALTSWSLRDHAWGALVDLPHAEAAINSIALSLEGDEVHLVAACSDSTVFSVMTSPAARMPTDGSAHHVLNGHSGFATSVVQSHLSGRSVILSGGVEGAVRLWFRDIVQNESLDLERATRHTGAITAVRTLKRPGLDTVFTSGVDGETRMWDLEHGTSGIVLDRSLYAISALEILNPTDPDQGFELLSVSDNGALNLVRVRDEVIIDRQPLGISLEGISALCLTHSGASTQLISGSYDGVVAVWSPQRTDPQVPRHRSLALHYGSVTAIASLPRKYGEELCAVGSQDGTLSLRRVKDLKEVATHLLPDGITDLAFIPREDSSVVVGLQNGCVWVLRDTVWTSFPAHELDVVRIDVAQIAGRMTIFTAGLDRCVRLWDLQTFTRLQEIPLSGLPNDMYVDGHRIAVATSTGSAVFEFSPESLLLLNRTV